MANRTDKEAAAKTDIEKLAEAEERVGIVDQQTIGSAAAAAGRRAEHTQSKKARP